MSDTTPSEPRPDALVEGNEVADEKRDMEPPTDEPTSPTGFNVDETNTEPYTENPTEDEKDRLDRHY